MTRRTGRLERSYFDQLYAADADPWRFATSDYERQKYDASLLALPNTTYDSALEVGCSIGVLTRLLAGRCRRLLALDVAETALTVARTNCALPQVTFENRNVPDEWPDGCFDLIVLSEVLYYFDPATLARVAERARAALLPAGTILLVHYLGVTDYPISGDEAADSFIAAVPFRLCNQRRAGMYRIDVLRNIAG